MKNVTRWYSERLECDTQLVQWGHYGRPMLLFPTAGGDAEEVERHRLIDAIEPWISAGKIKVYSVESVSGRTWLTNDNVAHCVWIQKQFDEYLVQEVIPAIRLDCHDEHAELIVAGASIGAFNALLALCRHPHLFSGTICMSGTYQIEHWLKGQWHDEFYYYSPLAFVPNLSDGDQLNRLRDRFVVLATGTGEAEDPDQSWNVAKVLGDKNIPNHVEVWDGWKHDWGTWRAMLPKYVGQLVD